LRRFISNTLAEVTVEAVGFRAGLAQCAALFAPWSWFSRTGIGGRGVM